MLFDVAHRTAYGYSTPVVQSQHILHLSPRPDIVKQIRNHALMIEPAPSFRYDGNDAFDNPIVVLDVEIPHENLIVHARSTIETFPARDTIDGTVSIPWNELSAWLSAHPNETLDVIQYRSSSRFTQATHEIADYARMSFPHGRPVFEAVLDLSSRIFSEFQFDPTATDVSTPITTVFKQRRGVCQDFSHFTLAGLRALGVPARYVSGYLLTLPPPGQPKLAGADASHAWIEVWTPDIGWQGFDPTNGILSGENHIPFAIGRDYLDVSPINGVLLGGGDHEVDVGVDVISLTNQP